MENAGLAKAKKNEDEVRKPMSGYMWFGKENRDKFAKGLEPKDVMKKLGDEWKKLSDKEKAKYEKMAKEDKERYDKETKAGAKKDEGKKAAAPAKGKKKKADSEEGSEAETEN